MQPATQPIRKKLIGFDLISVQPGERL